MKIAYLNSEYPSLSHTFIEREVRELRALGTEVCTYSIRPPNRQGMLGVDHAEAAASTFYILEGKVRLAIATLLSFVLAPRSFLRALVAAMRLSPPGLRARVTHLAYVAEACVLVKQLRSTGTSHVHVHMANNSAAVALLACKLDPTLEYSLSIHGSAEFFHVDSWTLKEKIEGAKFVRCISDFCKAQVMNWSDPSVWDRFHVVHCGVDTGRFVPRSEAKPAGSLRLLTVGRLHPIKGYTLLLEACRALGERGIDWSLNMVGDGPERARLESLAVTLDIADRVKFSGAVGQDEILPHFASADAMVISSFMEGVPVVLMEAMSAGLVVLATNVGGIPELVTQGETGVLVPPGSAQRLVDGLQQLARDRGRFPAMAAAARQKIIDEFSLAQVGDGMLKLFTRYAQCASAAALPADVPANPTPRAGRAVLRAESFEGRSA